MNGYRPYRPGNRVVVPIGTRRSASGTVPAIGLPWQETSITEDLLFELGTRFKGEIEIVSYTQNQEALTGADWRWEWLFEGETAWFGTLVQAKKLKAIGGAEYGYDFGYPSGKLGRPQVDVLLEYAAAQGLAPLYALYNGPSLEIDGQWWCPRLEPARPVMGVGLLAAETARYQVNFAADHRRVSQGCVTEWAVPLPCLALCGSWHSCAVWPPGAWTPPDLGFPDETSTGDIAYRAALAVSLLRARPAAGQLRTRVEPRQGVGVHIELPQAIASRLEAARRGDGEVIDVDGPAGAVVFHVSERRSEA